MPVNKPEEVKKDETKQLAGEKRIDALCKALTQSHGFVIPEEVYSPKDEDTEK